MKNKELFSAKNVTALAVLLALVIVLQAFGGSLNFGAVSLNFSLIPIVLGALTLGAWGGSVLGLANGIVVWIQVMTGAVPLYTIMWTNSPVITTLICLTKTTAAGFVAGWLFALLKEKNKRAAIFLCSGLVPIINTGLFIVGCFAMWNTMEIAANSLIGAGTGVVWFIFIGLVGVNFIAEFAVNLLVAPALHTVYKVVEKQFKR